MPRLRAPHGAFDSLEVSEELMGTERGLYFDDGIDEVRLVLGPHWWRTVQVGLAGDDQAFMAEFGDGSPN